MIYEKALKRRNLSGVVDDDQNEGDKEEEEEGTSAAGEGEGKKESGGGGGGKHASAGVGKVVNRMTDDANRVSTMLASLYSVYSAPMEIMIASVCLCLLLGWPASVGFVPLTAS